MFLNAPTLAVGLQIANYLPAAIESNQLVHFVADNENSHRTSYNEQVTINLGTINRAQQAHFFETRQFSDNHSELGLGTWANEHYQITLKNEGNLAFSYAVPKTPSATYKEWHGSSWIDAKEPLYSYVSAISYAEENHSFDSVLCVSADFGQYKLPTPKIVDGKLVCSDETEKISRAN